MHLSVLLLCKAATAVLYLPALEVVCAACKQMRHPRRLHCTFEGMPPLSVSLREFPLTCLRDAPHLLDPSSRCRQGSNACSAHLPCL